MFVHLATPLGQANSQYLQKGVLVSSVDHSACMNLAATEWREI
jgi:hypothetical protein